MSFTGQRDTDLLIMEKLDDYDLLKFCTTNKYTRELCQNEMFWRLRLLSKFGKDASKFKHPDRKWKDYYLKIIYALNMTSKEDPISAIQYVMAYPDVVNFLVKKFLMLDQSPLGRAVFLRDPLIQFLQNANFGDIRGPNGGPKIQTLLSPYLEQGFLSRIIITILFTIYLYANDLRFKDSFKAGPDMKKYLSHYPKLDSDSDNFRYNKIQYMISPGIIPDSELNVTQRSIVEDEDNAVRLEGLRIILSSILETLRISDTFRHSI